VGLLLCCVESKRKKLCLKSLGLRRCRVALGWALGSLIFRLVIMPQKATPTLLENTLNIHHLQSKSTQKMTKNIEEIPRFFKVFVAIFCLILRHFGYRSKSTSGAQEAIRSSIKISQSASGKIRRRVGPSFV